MKLDVLAIGVHPDDVELGCSGTLINEVKRGKKVGIVDLTQGELGTRGTIESRYQEAAAASEIMGIHARENLKMRDGFFKNDEDQNDRDERGEGIGTCGRRGGLCGSEKDRRHDAVKWRATAAARPSAVDLPKRQTREHSCARNARDASGRWVPSPAGRRLARQSPLGKGPRTLDAESV